MGKDKSRGLGLGMAQALASSGADIALVARTADELEQAASRVQSLGRKVLARPAGVSEIAGLARIVREVADHFGRLDIPVNAAGMTLRKPADLFTEQDWDLVMTTNLKSTFFMQQQGQGRIINVGSITSEVTIPNTALYAISKGGLRQLTRTLALEWAADGINVNAVVPGSVLDKIDGLSPF